MHKIAKAFFSLKKRARISYIVSVIGQLHPGEKKFFFGALFVFVISLAVMGINGFYATTTRVPTKGGTYSEGIIGQPILANPLLNQTNDADKDISELVYSGLLVSNGRGGVRPDLAEKCYGEEGGLIWTCVLRDNVWWHDGERFDADDVIFTVEAAQDPDTGSYLFNSWQGVVAERVSALEVRFHLRNTYAAFEENLKEFKILPHHIFQSLPRANYRLSEYNRAPVGTGPMRYVASTKRKDGFITSYEFEKNERYHRGPLFIERLFLKFYQNDDEAITAFNRREIDGFGNLSVAKREAIRVPVRTIAYTLPRYFAAFLNSSAAPALSDVTVRRALDLAIDKASLVKFVFQDFAKVAHGPIGEGMLGYETNMYSFRYDPEQALQLFEKSGWRLNSAESLVRAKGGVALEFDLVTPETPPLLEAAEFLKEAWAKIGVGITIVRAPLSDVARTYIQTRAYDMLLFGNIVNFNSDLFAFWHSSQKFHPGLNLSLFDSKETDRLIEISRQSLDRQARVQYTKDIVARIAAEVPAIFLFSPDYLYITNNKLKGIESALLLTPSERFSQIEKWHIKEVRVFQ